MTPSRLFRRPRALIVGYGDIGARCAPWLARRYRCLALLRDPARRAAARAAGLVPLQGDLDQPASLKRLAALAPALRVIVHLAPPPGDGLGDTRTAHLLAALRRRRGAATPAARAAIVPERPRRLVYASTSGVYGDRAGARIDETARVAPANARAQRRVAAEGLLRRAGARAPQSDLRVSILRVPGIYAAERLPLARLEQRMPALREAEDVYTNHIHADDLAAIVLRTLCRGKAQRIVHASDDSEMKMGDYFDRIAERYGRARPPRVSREAAQAALSPMMLSFMRESRRLDNTRLHRELGYRLRYPDVCAFLASEAACAVESSADGVAAHGPRP